MFDPSDQLFNYFHDNGHSELESYRLANRTSGRCLRTVPNNRTAAPLVLPTNKPMTENTQGETPDSEIIDLGFDVTEADVARPVLKAATLNAEIAFVRTVRTSKDQPQLNVGYRLTEPAVAIDGKSVNPGFMVFQRVLMVPSGDYTEAMKQDRLKRIHFAAVGAGHAKNTADWVGKPVRVQVRFRDAHDGYGASNEVGGVFPPSKAA